MLIRYARWGQKLGFTRTAKVTRLWREGCALSTRENLRKGERIWLRACDELGHVLYTFIGTVTWNESCLGPERGPDARATFSTLGYRCEVRFGI